MAEGPDMLTTCLPITGRTMVHMGLRTCVNVKVAAGLGLPLAVAPKSLVQKVKDSL